jgi:dipeptidyl aminopeptidase/acylaminoacyl peptidase
LGRYILFILLSWQAVARDPFTPSDRWEWRTIEDPQITADGQWVVYVQGWSDRQKDTAYCNLWLTSADGRQQRRLTEGPWNDRSPRWSADGKRIAWISNRGGAAAIRARSLDSADETEIATGGTPPLEIAWSPDGRFLAYTARAPRKAPAPWAPAAILPLLETGEPADSVEIFLAPLAGGAARQLTHDSFVERGPPVWMPDGQWILSSAAHAPDPAKPLEGAEIYGVHVPDGEVRRLTEHPGADDSPVPSPDGSKIAWIAAETKPPAYAIRKLWVMGVDGKRVKVLSGSLDRDVRDPQWSSDSRTVYFLADDRGATHVYAARNDGTVRQATNRPERLRGLSLADNGRAVTVRSNATAAVELATFAVDLPGGVTSLADPNEKLLATHDIAPTEELHFTSDGKDVQAWLVKPPRAGAAGPYPLLVEAGQTPREMCGGEFSLRAQIFAARGFAVLCVNTRGTPGYGEVFGNLLRTRFPGDDFDDLMRGVDAAVAKGGIDGKRIFVTGGLLAAWAIGHTDRFAAAVIRRPIADWTADVALHRDGYRRAMGWMGAMPWDDPDQYVKHSPVYFAQNFKTPTLVIGGGAEARELYFALQARKVDSARLRLESDGKPGTQIAEWEAELAWLGRFDGAGR